jgi:2,3-dihydroxybiphenyl 1,2-dioxygenase
VDEGSAALRAERGVLGLIRCEDPEGLAVEIYYGASLRTEQPFVSPTGVARFETGLEGLGHIAMASGRMEETRAFYRDLLGFVETDEIHLTLGPDFVLPLEFYHCNPRHHTLALAPMPAPQRLQHIMLEVSRVDDVGMALDRAIAAGCTIAQSLGRHTNDRMLSFYVVSPAGFQFEFGYGAIKVDDATWTVTRHDAGSSWGHRPPAMPA